VEMTTQEDVEHHTMAMCHARFHLTRDTPFMQEPMRSELGPLGVNTPAVQAIMQGTYQIPAECDEFTRDFLETIMASSPINSANRISCEITKEDFQSFWKKCKEQTSSSMSGCHYGHYKVAATNDLLSEVHALFTELAVTGGAPLSRWAQGLSCMLEKEAGVIKVNKLRAILLMEADFNFFNGLMFAKRMMQRVEQRNAVPMECYGSRRNHEAIEVAVNRRLVTDLLRQKRFPGAIASVDADTCYDRITHAAGSLCAQSFDVDPQAIIAMLLSIQHMKYYLRTAFGDSDNFFSSIAELVHYQGGCQGNKGAPAMWLVVSIFLVLMLHWLGHVARIRAAMSLALFVFAGFLFVDDTDLITVAVDKDESPAQVTTRMQAAVDAWHGGLHTTGGALKAAKSSWGLIAFYWNDGQWHYATKATFPGELSIPNSDGTRTIITRHEPSDAIKVVGVLQALDGNMTAQTESLRERADMWGAQIRDGWIPRNLARKALDTMIWPSLRYPLPACNLSESQGDLIHKLLYRQILPSLGACRNFPLIYRHAPASLQGLALPHAYVEQEISHLCMVLTHGAIDTPTGSLLRASLEQAQLEVGLGISFLETDFKVYGFLLTDCLWKSIWEFISKYKIRLVNKTQVLPFLQRRNDFFIMEALTGCKQLTPAELISCNRCRLALEAVTAADIVTGDGWYFRPDCLGANLSLSPRSRWEFPIEKPSQRDKTIWMNGLKLLSSPTY